MEETVRVNVGNREVQIFITHEGHSGTEATVKDGGGALLGYGVTKRHRADRFVKRKGVQLALGRALEGAGLSKEERRKVWNRVWNGKYARPRPGGP